MQDFITQPIVAFLIVAVAYAIGDIVSKRTKSWIPSVFVMAVLILLGFWTFIPHDIFELAGVSGPINTITVLLLVAHMGTTISIRELLKQWKVILICLGGLLGIIVCIWFVGGLFIDQEYLITGIPPLTGGIVATMVIQQPALEMGLERAAILCICVFVAQGFIGYPLTSLFLRFEAKRLMKDYRAGNGNVVAAASSATVITGKKLIPPVPAGYNSTAVSLVRMSIIGAVAVAIQTATGGWGAFKLHMVVVTLILAIVATEIGFLEKGILQENGCFNFIIFIVMLNIYSSLNRATPQMLLEIALPMLCVLFLGTLGMFLFSVLVGKVLGFSPYMSFACALNAMHGFPPNFIMTTEASNAISNNEAERQYLMDCMWPKMLVGGFTCVTITSVIIAGMFVPMLSLVG